MPPCSGDRSLHVALSFCKGMGRRILDLIDNFGLYCVTWVYIVLNKWVHINKILINKCMCDPILNPFPMAALYMLYVLELRLNLHMSSAKPLCSTLQH